MGEFIRRRTVGKTRELTSYPTTLADVLGTTKNSVSRTGSAVTPLDMCIEIGNAGQANPLGRLQNGQACTIVGRKQKVASGPPSVFLWMPVPNMTQRGSR